MRLNAESVRLITMYAFHHEHYSILQQRCTILNECVAKEANYKFTFLSSFPLYLMQINILISTSPPFTLSIHQKGIGTPGTAERKVPSDFGFNVFNQV